MMMIERNNREIAQVMAQWLLKALTTGASARYSFDELQSARAHNR
jgi:hypothetical protein